MSTPRRLYGGSVRTFRSTASASFRDAGPFAGSTSPATRKNGTHALLPRATVKSSYRAAFCPAQRARGTIAAASATAAPARIGRVPRRATSGTRTQARIATCAAGRHNVSSATPSPTPPSHQPEPVLHARTTAPDHQARRKAKTGSLETSWNRPAYVGVTSNTRATARAAVREIGTTAQAQPRSESA